MYKAGSSRILVGCAALIALAAVGAAADGPASGVIEPAVQSLIAQSNYNPTELRNIETLRQILASPQGLDGARDARLFCEDYKTRGQKPYQTLARLYGKPDGFNDHSLTGMQRHIKDVIAKNDRVYAEIHTTGVHSGRLYGVQGSGKSLTLYEKDFFRFDADGKLCEARRMAHEADLYRALGGTMTFPIDSRKPEWLESRK